MLFNSYSFIGVFLPVTLAGFYVIGWRSHMEEGHSSASG